MRRILRKLQKVIISLTLRYFDITKSEIVDEIRDSKV
jgi:hypothetical protein